MIDRRQLIAAGLALLPGPSLAQGLGIECCPPTAKALRMIRRLRAPVVEIGPGTGYWLDPMRRAGVQVAGGWDIRPRGPSVTKGDHRDAAAAAPDGAVMLAVWPPDGAPVQDWIAVRDWKQLVIVADFNRLDLGQALAAYREAGRATLSKGMFGPSTLRVYRRGPQAV